MAKYIAQIIITGIQIFGRALARSVNQELKASKGSSQAGGSTGRTRRHEDTIKSGLSLQEAQQILNVNKLDPEEIRQKYEHLFSVNDKSKGGSFYLQSKVVRAKERLEAEMRDIESEKSRKESSERL